MAMALNGQIPTYHIDLLRNDHGDQWTVEVRSDRGLWMVLFGGREEARCRNKNDASEIGGDIAVRTVSASFSRTATAIGALRRLTGFKWMDVHCRPLIHCKFTSKLPVDRLPRWRSRWVPKKGPTSTWRM